MNNQHWVYAFFIWLGKYLSSEKKKIPKHFYEAPKFE